MAVIATVGSDGNSFEPGDLPLENTGERLPLADELSNHGTCSVDLAQLGHGVLELAEDVIAALTQWREQTEHAPSQTYEELEDGGGTVDKRTRTQKPPCEPE